MPKVSSLLELIREQYKKKGRALKIVADWDDCLQPIKPMVIARMNPHLIKDYSQFIHNYWEASIASKSVSGSQILVSCKDYKGSPEEAEAVNKFEEFRKESRKNPEKHNFLPSGGDLYAESPLLSSCDELLQAIKEEGLVEDLVCISSYRKGKHNGYANEGAETVVKQKSGKIKRTFGKFPFTKIEMTGCDRSPVHGSHFIPYRWEVLRDKFPDFDILVDDNPQIIKECQENLPSDKIYALPDYKCNRWLENENTFLFPVTVSNLKDSDFVCEEKKDLVLNSPPPKNYTPWIIGGVLILLVSLGGLVYWLVKKKK